MDTTLIPLLNGTDQQGLPPFIPLTLFRAAMTLMTCAGNVFVIVVVSRTLLLRTVTNGLLVNLAVSDLMMGLYQLLETIRSFRTNLIRTYGLCIFKMSFILFIVLASGANLLGE